VGYASVRMADIADSAESLHATLPAHTFRCETVLSLLEGGVPDYKQSMWVDCLSR